jgi:hypothetical protein
MSEVEGEFKKRSKFCSFTDTNIMTLEQTTGSGYFISLSDVEDAKQEIFQELQRIAKDGCHLPELSSILKKWFGS